MIELRAVVGPTGRQLKELLEERGVAFGERGADAIVSYGVRVTSALPTLNGNAGKLDKFEELAKMAAAGIAVPKHSRNFRDAQSWNTSFLGRQLHHARGRDINLYQANAWRANPDDDFFTEYIDKVAEYRVWAFRRTPKALYKKERGLRVRQRGAFVWNRRNGYNFEFIPADDMTPRQKRVSELGAAAIQALDLDFGAADVIVGPDGTAYVLEVNTAPGVEGPRWGITSLADSIAKWAQNNYPRRKGDNEQPNVRERREQVGNARNVAHEEALRENAERERIARERAEAARREAERVRAARRAELQAAVGQAVERVRVAQEALAEARQVRERADAALAEFDEE